MPNLMTKKRFENVRSRTLWSYRLCVLISAFLGGAGFFCCMGYGQQPNGTLPNATSISTAKTTVGSTQGKASQRWIPIDRRKLGELGRLGELLQDPPPTRDQEPIHPLETSPLGKKNALPFDLSKVDVRSLENQVSNLSPEQRERLKQLAKQFAVNQTIEDLASSFKELPPSLVDQIRNSQSLRELAKDFLDGEGLDQDNVESLDIFLDAQDTEPWIKFDPANSSLRSRGDDDLEVSQNRADSSDNARDTPPSESVPADNLSLSRPTSGMSNRSQQPAVDASTSATDAILNRSYQTSEGKSGRSNPSSDRPPNVSGNRSPQAPQSSQIKRTSAAQINTPPQPQKETAFDSFRRRLAELGLGQTLAKLTKEAVGLEQKRASDSNIISNSPEKESRSENRGTYNTQASQKGAGSSRSRLDSIDPFNAPPSHEISRTGVNSAESTGPTNTAQSSLLSDAVSPPPSTASSQPSLASENFVGAWRAPSWEDLPSFSFFQIGGILLLVVVIVGILFMNRAPEIARAARQKRHERALKDGLMEMEISNREQVVLAFDTVASQKLRAFEDWWTAQRVVMYATEQNMDISPKLQTAAVVYNQARYSPPDRGLSKEELSAVREAILDCVKSRSLG